MIVMVIVRELGVFVRAAQPIGVLKHETHSHRQKDQSSEAVGRNDDFGSSQHFLFFPWLRICIAIPAPIRRGDPLVASRPLLPW
jgi:hypothetical protein